MFKIVMERINVFMHHSFIADRNILQLSLFRSRACVCVWVEKISEGELPSWCVQADTWQYVNKF